MFGIPTIRMYRRAWFETPEEAEEWVKANPQHKILGAYKDGSEGFKEHKYDEATSRNCNMEKYHAVIVYSWRPSPMPALR